MNSQPIASTPPYHTRGIAICILVTLLAALLSGFIYINDKRLQDTSDQLFSFSRLLLRHINLLPSIKVKHERLTYEYYATTDRDRLLPAIKRAEALMDDLFAHLKNQSLPMANQTPATLKASSTPLGNSTTT